MIKNNLETVDKNAELVWKIQSSDNRAVATDLVLLYRQNLGFIVNCIKEYGLLVDYHARDYEDYLQVSYLALVSAVRRFKFGLGIKFITYFRFWMKRYVYNFRMKSTCQFHVPEREASTFARDELPKIKILPIDDCFKTEYSAVKSCGMEELDAIECQLYKNQIWEEARRLLTPENYAMVYARFVEGVEFSVIAERVGITYDAARLRVHRSLVKLKRSPILRVFAQDLYGIRI